MACYNRKSKTIECLKNLFAQSQVNILYSLKVFLVDDASTDGTSEAVAELFPEVTLVAGNGQLYWNRGMHKAWELAKASGDFDFFLWLNDDTNLKSNAIVEMLQCAEIKNNAAIVCGAICSEVDNNFTYGGRDADGREIYPKEELQTCYTINGNCVLVSRFICNEVGILDPVFPHAIGDYEYGLRAIKNGFEIVTTRQYIGFCERNPTLPAWCYGSVPINKRLKALYSPLGNSHPYYFFVFEKKYYGWLTAIKHFLTIHLRVLIPALWK